MRNTQIAWASTALVIAALAACGDLIGDPFFDRWCGDKLCNWDLDEGRIERVASWHERDYAVALLDAPTQLSQLSEHSVQCIRFVLMVDADAGAELSLALDFNDDKTIDYSRKLPAAHWKRMTFDFHAPAYYDKLRFILRKDGEGRAVVAQLRAYEGDDCTGPSVELSGQLPGSVCRNDDECRLGVCTEQRCAECREDADCDDGALCVSGACSQCREDADCGADLRCVWSNATARGAGRACVADDLRLARGLRELCDRDTDCVGTRCGVDEGAAKTCGLPCGEDRSCPDELTCKTLIDTRSASWNTIQLCAEPSPAGSACIQDSECASGHCCDETCSVDACD